MSHLSLIQLRRWFCTSAILLFLGGFSALADSTPFKIELVWGTDGAKPDDKKWEQLDPNVREKLHHLHLKNYWVVKTKIVDLVGNEIKRSVLSDKCTVELQQLPNGQLEVKLFTVKSDGTTNKVCTVQHSAEALKKGEHCIVGGDSKENRDDAWMVIISGGKPK